MKKILPRLILFPLLFSVLLGLLFYILVTTMFSPRTMKSVIQNQLQNAFARPVSMDSARFYFNGKIKITGLKVYSLPGEEGIYPLKADSVYASYDMISLIFRKISVNKLFFENPEINLLKTAKGWNFMTMFRGKKRKSTLSKIKEAVVKNASVTVLNPAEKEKKKYFFSDINVEISDFRPDAESFFRLSCSLRNLPFVKNGKAAVFMEGRFNTADFRWEKAYLKNVEISSTLMDFPLTAELSLENFRKPQISGDIEISGFNSLALAKIMGRKLPFNIPAMKISVDMKLDAEKRKAEILSANLRNESLDVNINGNVSFGGKKHFAATVYSANPVNLREINEIFPSFPAKRLSGKAQFKVNLSNRDGGVSFSRLFLNIEGAGGVYKKFKFGNLRATALVFENMEKSKFKMKTDWISAKDNKLEKISLNAAIRENALKCDMDASWKGNPFRGALTIKDLFSRSKRMELAADFSYMRLETMKEIWDAVLEEIRSHGKKNYRRFSQIEWVNRVRNSIPSGYRKIKIDMHFGKMRHAFFESEDLYASADMENLSGVLEKLKGRVAVKSQSGRFFEVEKNSRKNRIYRLFALPILVMYDMRTKSALKIGLKLKDVNFRTIGVQYTMDNGRVNIDNFYLDGKEFSAYSSGKMNLLNETIDLKVYTISSKYYSMGTLPQLLTDQSGKPALAFRLKGKMNDPVLKMLNPRKTGKTIRKAKERGVSIDAQATKTLRGG